MSAPAVPLLLLLWGGGGAGRTMVWAGGAWRRELACQRADPPPLPPPNSFPALESQARRGRLPPTLRPLTLLDPVLDPITHGVFKMVCAHGRGGWGGGVGGGTGFHFPCQSTPRPPSFPAPRCCARPPPRSRPPLPPRALSPPCAQQEEGDLNYGAMSVLVASTMLLELAAGEDGLLAGAVPTLSLLTFFHVRRRRPAAPRTHRTGARCAGHLASPSAQLRAHTHPHAPHPASTPAVPGALAALLSAADVGAGCVQILFTSLDFLAESSAPSTRRRPPPAPRLQCAPPPPPPPPPLLYIALCLPPPSPLQTVCKPLAPPGMGRAGCLPAPVILPRPVPPSPPRCLHPPRPVCTLGTPLWGAWCSPPALLFTLFSAFPLLCATFHALCTGLPPPSQRTPLPSPTNDTPPSPAHSRSRPPAGLPPALP